MKIAIVFKNCEHGKYTVTISETAKFVRILITANTEIENTANTSAFHW